MKSSTRKGMRPAYLGIEYCINRYRAVIKINPAIAGINHLKNLC